LNRVTKEQGGYDHYYYYYYGQNRKRSRRGVLSRLFKRRRRRNAVPGVVDTLDTVMSGSGQTLYGAPDVVEGAVHRRAPDMTTHPDAQPAVTATTAVQGLDERRNGRAPHQ